jgi:hypothetical protein
MLRFALTAAILACLAIPSVASSQISPPTGAHAQPPAKPAAPAIQDDAARQDMLRLFETYCLNRLTRTPDTYAAVGPIRFPKAGAAEAAAALKGRKGSAWSADTGHGHFVVAVWANPITGCAVTGNLPGDRGLTAGFDIVVAVYGGTNEYGDLARPALRHGKVDGKPATLQLILAAPSGAPRQAFVNMDVANPDGTVAVRLARELDPSDASTSASPSPASPSPATPAKNPAAPTASMPAPAMKP